MLRISAITVVWEAVAILEKFFGSTHTVHLWNIGENGRMVIYKGACIGKVYMPRRDGRKLQANRDGICLFLCFTASAAYVYNMEKSDRIPISDKMGVFMQYTWNDIERHVADCTRCPLSQTRNLPVMGCGNHQASIMLIAEAPGGQEDQQGTVFVGRSGEVLDSLLRDCGLTREEIYITNILKCHPPGNRNPKEEEKEACFPYLKYETFLLKPKIIVCLGRVAAQRIISPDFKITRQHGAWTCRKDCAMTATYHPSAILRDSSKYDVAKIDFCEIVRKREELS